MEVAENATSNGVAETQTEPIFEVPNKIVQPPPVIHTKKSSKEEKLKKKDDRSIEQILKGLGTFETAEEKLAALFKKYMELADQNRKNSVALKQIDKKVTLIQKENEQVTTERGKAVLAKSRLENLCRELQKQNKAIKEESLAKVREEEEKRKEVSTKFQNTLSEITELMAEANKKNDKLYEDNIEMETKFRALLEEMTLREQRFENMKQMMNHELQLAKATLAKVSLEMAEEKETLLKDKNTLLIKLTEYQARIKELQTTEANLRSQVALYTDKYNEFQNALAKSNEVFGGFNEEMEKMSKKIVKLEKETSQWKSRWEKSHAALLEMAADKQSRDAELVMSNKKCIKLQELCKTFQQERANLIAQLKERDGITKPQEEKLADNSQENGVASGVENPLPALNGSILKREECDMHCCQTKVVKPKGRQKHCNENQVTKNKKIVHKEISDKNIIFICEKDTCCKKDKLAKNSAKAANLIQIKIPEPVVDKKHSQQGQPPMVSNNNQEVVNLAANKNNAITADDVVGTDQPSNEKPDKSNSVPGASTDKQSKSSEKKTEPPNDVTKNNPTGEENITAQVGVLTED